MVTKGESKTLPNEITDLTMSSTPVENREHSYRRNTSSTAFNILKRAKPTMSPNSEYNKNKTFKAESYHSQDVTIPSVAMSTSTLIMNFPLLMKILRLKNTRTQHLLH